MAKNNREKLGKPRQIKSGDGNGQLSRLRRPPPLSTQRFFTEEYPPPPSPHDDDFHGPIAHQPYEEDSALIEPAWKRRLYKLLEQPTSSKAAFIVHMFVTFMIVFSAFVTVLETVPAVHEISTRVWFGLETSVVALFTIEYIARLIAWSNTWSSLFSWVLSFYGVIDLLSVLPYYLELLMQQDTSVYFRFSILRMFRLLRIFRPFRYNHTILLYVLLFFLLLLFLMSFHSTIEVMYLSVRRSQHALLAIGFFVVMILTVFSTLLYFAERGTWDEVLGTFINTEGDPTQFSSIPAAAWFVLVTITTVGYGEITPRSFLGRLITIPILVFGLLFITLPSFVLGREFSHVWEKLTQDRLEVAEENGNNVVTEDPDADLGMEADPENGTARASGSASARSAPHYRPARVHRHFHLPPLSPPLAQNQTELSRQIEELAGVVDVQGRMLSRLLELLEEKEGVKDQGDKAEREKGKEKRS
ncbi:hypothetical protein CPB84DRAFT_1835815 [Gymnopilus junonius]|uniref:Voltage-gated potassium channel n=1 Tax=Gymnopilus junonius TaxID=109634 RepID=A0A9P5NP37_GYMJU|nr:hypothetical protein CPB84DRAFT_1835815 [Gymnopilus junonius]